MSEISDRYGWRLPGVSTDTGSQNTYVLACYWLTFIDGAGI